MKVVNYVQIDFSKNKDITVPSMQYDSGSRWVRLKLFNNGIPVNLNGIRVCIMVAKPDGKEVFNDCVIVDAENGLVEFEITNQMVVVAGEVECQIKLMEQDKLLSSEIFTLFVNKGLTPTNIDSENELNVLVDALNRVEHLDQELSGEIMASFEASQTQRDETFKEKLLEYDERFLEIKGEKGDKGDKGDTGERGLQGPVGPQGSKGDMGEQGPVGPQGPKGDKGDQGEVGAIGPIGLQGPIGLTGPQGETGPQGPKGEKGLDGRSVELGVYGGQVKWRYAGQEENVGWTPLISLDSLRGSQGPQGEKGETGPQGPKGEKGDSGGVMPADMVDYMGNQHETLKAKNDADVDWLLGEINTAHYEGQQITATDSIEGRAKSAILKGQTLVNLINVKNATGGIAYTAKDLNLAYELPVGKYILLYDVIKANTSSGLGAPDRHTPILTFDDGTKTYQGFEGFNTTSGKKYWLINATKPIVKVEYWLANLVEDGEVDNLRLFVYQDGMENWDIPYFEGMQSVKLPVLTTTGKNLWNGVLLSQWCGTNGSVSDNVNARIIKMKVEPNTKYTVSRTETGNRLDIIMFSQEPVLGSNTVVGNALNASSNTDATTFTTTSETHWIIIRAIDNVANYTESVEFQIEFGNRTPHEPFKSNILHTPEEVVLRSLPNGAKDTLNLNTGEYVQRIKEVTFDGSNDEGWAVASQTNSTTQCFDISVAGASSNNDVSIATFCDKFPSYTASHLWSYEKEGVGNPSSRIRLRLNAIRLSTVDVAGLRTYLQSNPITVQYELATPVIKTVDLKVVDQDGNETVHENGTIVYSHKDTTHYICGSEDSSLIPSLSIDVPTNLPAVVTRQKTMIHELEVENKALIDELQRVEEKSDQADLEQLSTTWEIDYRVSELEWFVEDNISSTMTVAEKINLKLGGNTMALSRFEQAKILILAGAYNRETLEKQLTNYLKRGYLTTEEYDELIALMDAKELVSEN